MDLVDTLQKMHPKIFDSYILPALQDSDRILDAFTDATIDECEPELIKHRLRKLREKGILNSQSYDNARIDILCATIELTYHEIAKEACYQKLNEPRLGYTSKKVFQDIAVYNEHAIACEVARISTPYLLAVHRKVHKDLAEKWRKLDKEKTKQHGLLAAEFGEYIFKPLPYSLKERFYML